MNNTRPHQQSLHRCFFALKFSAEIEGYLLAITNGLRRHDADVAWTPQRNLHLTLRFLGDITGDQLRRVRTLPATADRLGLGFALRASGLGAFPTLRSARALWAGVDGDSPDHRAALHTLQAMTEGWARQIGLSPEGRRYSPHITLGRVRRASAGLRNVVDAVTTGDCHSPVCTITELLLMQSVQTERGTEYNVVEHWHEGSGK